jgi:hypothetical protein
MYPESTSIPFFLYKSRRRDIADIQPPIPGITPFPKRNQGAGSKFTKEQTRQLFDVILDAASIFTDGSVWVIVSTKELRRPGTTVVVHARTNVSIMILLNRVAAGIADVILFDDVKLFDSCGLIRRDVRDGILIMVGEFTSPVSVKLPFSFH